MSSEKSPKIVGEISTAFHKKAVFDTNGENFTCYNDTQLAIAFIGYSKFIIVTSITYWTALASKMAVNIQIVIAFLFLGQMNKMDHRSITSNGRSIQQFIQKEKILH